MLRCQHKAGRKELGAAEIPPTPIRIHLKQFPLFNFPEALPQECSGRLLCYVYFRALESDHLPGFASCYLCDLGQVT